MTPKLLSPDDPRAPKFWMYEESGVLAPVVQKYLEGAELTRHDVQIMKTYLRQWIDSPVWQGEPIDRLRRSARMIYEKADIHRWIRDALALKGSIRYEPV
jgi:hypothetical protein